VLILATCALGVNRISMVQSPTVRTVERARKVVVSVINRPSKFNHWAAALGCVIDRSVSRSSTDRASSITSLDQPLLRRFAVSAINRPSKFNHSSILFSCHLATLPIRSQAPSSYRSRSRCATVADPEFPRDCTRLVGASTTGGTIGGTGPLEKPRRWSKLRHAFAS
jgi:hypothetical protein